MKKILACLMLVSQSLTGQTFDDLIDYQSLDHTIELTHFRAGNHDSSGLNEYYFQASLYALAVLKEDRKKDFSERRKVMRDLGEFGDIQLKTLAFWKKANPVPQIDVQGEDIRSLASEAMRTFEISESQVAILARIQLNERNKRFFILGEDTVIGATTYYIIPESLPHKPIIENNTIEIVDKLGTHVKLMTKFDLLDPKKKRKK
ncbi:hypothetical protein [Pseudobacteriovorax antillogorgiicola]|uniref:Uncharacterized protein n=1 Tax=Pseudobacteriovorax antillogorgiicola TaxID=1513793 RepID=A0A1Y6BJZ6_9BACT|nr:hypothetical protein [Pseudobacteriovorax antillogorgiicola]TCS55287.1 hypothetical protein EDD56_1058 [Pseudobacteriovorax antillogorgiicola]SMF14747.1 hypothetical protein SAMN06296036_105316 [Pseudobacteriovorax antillogorgiicola]